MQQQEGIYKYQPLWGSWMVDEMIGAGSFGQVYQISKELYGKKYISAVKMISIPSKHPVLSLCFIAWDVRQ